VSIYPSATGFFLSVLYSKKNISYFENSFGEAKNNYIFAAAYGV
jgi:hypothetical protein